MTNKIRIKRDELVLEKLTSGIRNKDDFEIPNYNPFWVYTTNEQVTKKNSESNFYHNIYEIRSEKISPYPEINAVSTLYLCALQSAFLHNDTQSSLYTIFKNAEKLIPDIIKADENTPKENFHHNVITEGKYKYFCMPLSDTHIMRSKDCYGRILFYKLFIPTTHIDNMSKSEIDILKQIKLLPFSKIESYIYRSNKQPSHRALFRQWKKKVDDEKYVAKLEPEFEKAAQIFAERAKTLPEKYFKRSTKYPLNRFNSVVGMKSL